MPGIFGVIVKPSSKRDIVCETAYSMKKLLLHQSWYRTDMRVSPPRYALGSISLGKDREIQEVRFNGKTYLFLIDGYVYSVNGIGVKTLKNTSEDIVKGLSEEGDEFLPRVAGNYTIAILCIDTNELVLFNDRMGPRRIYYADHGDMVVFAPEVKAISFLPMFHRELDWKGVSDFFNFGYVLGRNTFFKGIWSLPSSSVLKVSPSQAEIQIKKYWQPKYTENPGEMNEYADTCYSLIRDSIAEKIDHAESIISPISGGLDSRLILAMLKKLNIGKLIKPVTYGQRFSYEYKNAKKVCSTLGFNNHTLVDINPKELLPYYSQAVWLSEGMIPMLNCHLRLMPECIDGHWDCLFNGIYGGPTNYSAEYYREDHLASNPGLEEKVKDISKVIQTYPHHYDSVLRSPFPEMIRENVLQSVSDELKQHLQVSDRFCNQRDAFFIENRMRRFINQSSLYRFFWEEQLPLSNYKLYDFYLSTPPKIKMHRELLKTILKRHFPHVASISDANTGLNLYQQPTSWYYKKREIAKNIRYYTSRISLGRITFYDRSTYAHYEKWFQRHKKTFAFYHDQLTNRFFREIDFINASAVEDVLSSVRKKGYGFHSLARLTTFSIWYRLFVLGEGVEEIRDRLSTRIRA